MTCYITYMEVRLHSDGVTPTELTTALCQYGWKPIYGRYDYAFRWDDNWGNKDHNMNEYFEHMNKVHQVLKGYDVWYSLRTFEAGKENFWVKWSE